MKSLHCDIISVWMGEDTESSFFFFAKMDRLGPLDLMAVKRIIRANDLPVIRDN